MRQWIERLDREVPVRYAVWILGTLWGLWWLFIWVISGHGGWAALLGLAIAVVGLVQQYPKGEWPSRQEAMKALKMGLPAMSIPLIIIGGILSGAFTPTEAGAMGAIGACLLAAMQRRLSWALVESAMASTMRMTAMVVFILIGSRAFSLVFQGIGGGLWIEHLLSNLPGGQIGFLVVVNLFIFFLAFFLDFFEIAFIIVPLLAPVADKMGIDLIWFGVLLGANLQTSFMHPPFGFALFYLRSVAPPSIKSSDILMGSIPWVIIMLLMVILVILFPGMVSLSVQIFGRF